MGLLCFKCNNVVHGSCKEYIQHLRIVHQIIEGGMFTCATPCNQDGCFRVFNYTWSLKRHLYKQHRALFDMDGHFNEHPQRRCVHATAPVINNDCDNNSDMDDNDNEVIEPALSIDDIKLKSAQLICNLKASNSVTNTTVSLVKMLTLELIFDVVGCIRHKISNLVADLGIDEHNDILQELHEDMMKLEAPFSEINTDYKFMKYLKDSNHFIEPISMPLGIAYVQRNDPKTGEVRQIQTQHTYQYIPIKSVLKQVLERPGVMESIIEHQAIIHEELMKDFQDGDYFKNNHFLTRKTINILLYNDDVEVTNPLGPKAGCHKLSMVYFTIKSFPSKFLSTLDHCFLVAIFKSDHAKNYGLQNIMQPVVNELKSLELDGIEIRSSAFTGKVYIKLAQVVGDNLGVHGMLGFTQSFSANYPCRKCKTNKHELKTQFVEGVNLRNIDNYEEDVARNDLTNTGIKNASIFNELEAFHVTKNFAPDLMHDLLEGVCMWELKLVIKNLIRTGKFTLQFLNGRITSYDYGFPDSANKPCCFTDSDLRNLDSAAGQKSAQMYCLMRHFCLMMGDVVEINNKFWEVILLLLKCMDIIFSPVATTEVTFYLKNLIEDHHQLYLEVFPEQYLKPKHHFMVHYPRAIRELGPLVQYWAIRFEAKHNFFKRIAHINCNFKNIALTLAYRHQMKLCYTTLSRKSMKDSMLEVGPGTSVVLASLDNADAVSLALGGYQIFDDVFIANWIIKYGTKYRKGMMLIIGHTEDSDPVFGKICHVLVLEQSHVQLVIETWTTLYFCEHLHAYAVRPKNSLELVALNVEELEDFHPLHATKAYFEGDTWYISPRYKF